MAPTTVHGDRSCWMQRLVAVLSGLCVLLVTGTASADTGIRVAGTTYLGDLPTLVADRQGLFRRAGLDAAVTYSATGAENLDRLRAGDVDFALMAVTPLVLDLLGDRSPGGAGDPVILANLLHATGLTRLIVRADSPLRQANDLTGRRVGLVRGTDADFVWWLFAHMHGLDASKVTVVDYEIEALGEALMGGEVEAAVLWQPWIARLVEARSADLRGLGHDAPYSARWVVVTRRAVLREYPARVRHVLAAYREAIEFIERRPDTAVKLYAEHVGVTLAALGDYWSPLDYDLSLDWGLVAALQQQFAWARRAGYPLHGTAGVLTILDTGPLRTVAPDTVGLPASFGAGGGG